MEVLELGLIDEEKRGFEFRMWQWQKEHVTFGK